MCLPPKSEADWAKIKAANWNYLVLWFPLVPKKGKEPLSEKDLREIKDKSEYPFLYELRNDVLYCNNEHGSIAFIDRGYLPPFFIQ